MWNYKSVNVLDIIHCLYVGIDTKNIRKFTAQAVCVVGPLGLHGGVFGKSTSELSRALFLAHIFMSSFH